ncbi:MAG TPA: FAD-dependent oxidoreductase [Acidimicrobiales bacterium]|nr:FAD-dependent oxidoreductase [Acidimicrobiales bacterium]
MELNSETITVIGAHWCPDCRRAKAFLAEQRVAFDWIDLEQHPDATEIVERINGGSRAIPTIIFPDGSHLTEPGNDELADKLGLQRSAKSSTYDVLIVGGGPTGLTAAIYAARENQSVLIVEKSAPGGQAGVTERLDNYPGFPDGVAGFELADRMRRQAERYGVEILQAVAVNAVSLDGDWVSVATATGDVYRARAVLVATGSVYRRTEAEGESDLIGAGVHFCATCDGPFYRGAKEVLVIGGGNSGLEEALFLTQFADHVTIIEYSDKLAGSRLLQDKVNAHSKMSVMTNTKVVGFKSGATGKLESVELEDRVAGARTHHEATGAFVFIGLDPNTEFLDGVLELDDRGFLISDEQFRTNLAGVFVAGDVRRGSTKQLASAVGEGAAASIQIRYYLDKIASRTAS